MVTMQSEPNGPPLYTTMIRKAPDEAEQRRILKVKLPTPVYNRLHQSKLLGGLTVSEIVEHALEQYLQAGIPRRTEVQPEDLGVCA
jgi:hypothetical protein